jgi:hypothetical protein
VAPRSGSACIYELAEETVFVLYSTHSNSKNNGSASAWRVPVDTVIEIGVHFKEDKDLSELGFDLSKFKMKMNTSQGGSIM